MHQAGILAHKISASKYLNTGLLLLAMLMLVSSAALAEDTPLALDEVFLAVLINQQPQGVVFLLRSDDRLYAGSKDLRRWRLRLPDTTPLTLDGEDFYALDALAGLSYRFDESSQALSVQAPPSLFDATLLKGTVTNFSAPTPASPGGFLNYDVSANHAQGRTATSGLLELGGFGGWGAGQTRILARDLDGHASAIRLDTTWTRDQPISSPACDSATRSAARAAGGERCASAACSGRLIFPPSLASSLSRCQGCLAKRRCPPRWTFMLIMRCA